MAGGPAKYRFLWRRVAGAKWNKTTVTAGDAEEAVEAMRAHIEGKLRLDTTDVVVDHPFHLLGIDQKPAQMFSLRDLMHGLQYEFSNKVYRNRRPDEAGRVSALDRVATAP